jgi:hypothetical protein
MVFVPCDSDDEHDKDNNDPLLRPGEHEQLENAFHFSA